MFDMRYMRCHHPVQMNKAPRLVYLLRKSRQVEETAVPVLKRDDLPLRFYYKGREINIEATPKGNLIIKESRLTGETGE